MESVICSHTKFKVVDEVVGLQIKQCSDCFLVFRDLKPEDLQPSDLYKDYYSSKQKPARFFNLLEFIVKLFRRWRAFEISKLTDKIRVLDIGCGRGLTLWFLQEKYSADVVGTQISEVAAEYARQSLGLEVLTKDLLEQPFQPNQFSVVTMYHVLEHVPNPVGYIIEIGRILEPGGYLLIEVPNWNSWTRQLVGQFWLGYDVKHHISFFNDASLVEMLKKNGFSLVSHRSFSAEYSIFISVSSLTSWLTKRHHNLFETLQGHKKISSSILIDIFLFALLLLPAIIMNVLLYKTSKGEVLHIVAQKS
jgi:2-polyprenyl-3-methyl-5-hydroxy-6-metoxy-1,4-benzoquinol methylase